MVHAYADGPYDRSSFHLAGGPTLVATLASEIAKGAIQGLLVTPQSNDEDSSRHPFVGLVDHVAVMPLNSSASESEMMLNSEKDDEEGTYHKPTGWAARRIGAALDQLGVEVYYYGDAHPNGIPLATVRKERTSFFRSGGLSDNVKDEEPSSPGSRAGVATVGAPSTFVENFNIRLRCDRDTARSLTRTLRERDGGLLGVEALTLPYTDGRFEVACNLLRPDVGSSEALEARLNQWATEKIKELALDSKHDLVERAYRVGTTVDQCIEAISLSGSVQSATEYDDAVMERLRGYLSGV